MYTRLSLLIIFLITSLFVHACSSNSSPVEPAIQVQSENLQQTSHHLWGFYLLSFNQNENTLEILPGREITDHFNVLKFLEYGPCSNCLKITSFQDMGEIKKVDIKITHPFTSKNLTGFDVRGIVMFPGSYTFPSYGLNAPDGIAGSDGGLVNADGYTALYNYTTKGYGPDGLQGYLKGKYATATAPTAKLNGYKRFVSPINPNTRNIFEAGTSITVTYEMKFPSKPFLLGYAIDASWVKPKTKPVNNPVTDFPPEANCAEPWKITVTESTIDGGLTDLGGSILLTIDAYDYTGKGSLLNPKLECPQLFYGIIEAPYVSNTSEYARYAVTISNAKKAPAGNHMCLIRIEDVAQASAPSWLDFRAYQIKTLYVASTGWANTWGGTQTDFGYDVATDSSGNVYAVGTFKGTVDFDPGPLSNEKTSNGMDDAFLCKYSSTGKLAWIRTWGGTDYDDAVGITIGPDEFIYVTGSFKGTVDFDPGTGEDIHSSAGSVDCYISKFDQSGNFIWTKTWGGPNWDMSLDLASDDQGVYSTGTFTGTADFNPGTGEDMHTASNQDAFLMSLQTNGNFRWARTWGGSDVDQGNSVIAGSSSGIWVAGNFRGGIVDFDPGSGTDYHSSNGFDDAFLVRYASNGNYGFSLTWGGVGYDLAAEVTLDSSGNAYVIGSFQEMVDFDPGAGVSNMMSNGSDDIYLVKFGSDAALKWVRTWGGTAWDEGAGVAAFDDKFIYATGYFRDVVDFDFGSGSDLRTSEGGHDVFLMQISCYGEFNWVRNFGSDENDHGLAATSDFLGNAIMIGDFAAMDVPIDFDPSPGSEDNHLSKGLSDVFLVKYLSTGAW